MNDFLNDLRDNKMPAFANMFHITIDYNKKTYTKVAASHINIQVNQPFSE